MTGCRTLFLLAAVAALSACDNTPNKNFEQSVKDREAAAAGDPYVALESKMPRLSYLTYRKKEEYRDYSEGQSGTFRAAYDSALKTLDGDKTLDRASELFKSCRDAFAGASAYQSDSGKDAAAAADPRNQALAALKSCRNDAKKAGDTGAVLARFASTGIVMIGAKLVGQGDQEGGITTWREGERFVSEDKPAFELGIKSLRGY